MQGENFINLPCLSFDRYHTRMTALHFDLTKSNIFIDNSKNISIIDFDDAKYGSAIYDIAILISFFFLSTSRGIDFKNINFLIDSYYGEDASLKEAEVPLIKNCAIQWVDFLLIQTKLSASLINTFEAKRKLILENM